MLGDFNPYQQWLDIPPEEQPPTLYRLVGVGDFETDTRAIRSATNQHVIHVKTFRTDENAIFLDLLIKEIQEAGKILLDPGKKKKYDQKLKAQGHQPTAAKPAGAAAVPSDSGVLSDTPSSGSAVGQSDIHAAAGRSGVGSEVGRSGVQGAAARSGVRGKTDTSDDEKPVRNVPTWVYLAVGGGVGLVAIVAAVLIGIFALGDNDEPAPADGTTLAEQQGSGDGQDSAPDPAAGPDKKALQIEPVDDVSIAPGTLVRIPLVLSEPPAAVQCNIASGPLGATIPDSGNVFVWQTGPADAGSKHEVSVTAEHPDRDAGQMAFTIRVDDAGEPVALLSLTDVQRDAVAGEWREEEGALISPNSSDRPRIELPFAPPQSYDLSLDVEKFEGATGLQIGLVSGAARWSVFLDGPTGSGLMRIDSKDYHVNITSCRAPVFAVGEARKVVCRVRPSQVQVVCNGTLIVNFRGDFARVSAPDEWATPHVGLLSIGANEATYRISNVVLTPVTAGSSDPSGQLGDEIPGLVELEGHYYKAFFDQVPWADARRRCEQLGGYLACIDSGLEQSYVAGIRDRTQVWLGGSDQQQEGQWTWVNGAALDFNSWLTGRPDNRGGNENYLSMTASGAWDDEPGHRAMGYICEWDAPPGTKRVVEPPPNVAVTEPPRIERIERISVPRQTEVETYVTQFRSYLERQPLETREKRVAFVRRMIDLAKDREKKPAERYVRLRESQRLAAENGDADLAIEAIDVLAEQFDFDPLPAKQQSVVQAFQNSTTPEQAAAAKDHLVAVIDDALKRDACDAAMQAAQVGYNETLKAAKKQFRPEFYELRKKVEPKYEEWQKFAKFEEALAKNPNDPEANLQVGRRYCIRRDDWQRGLPLLAKGGDPGLRALAEAELSGSQTPADRIQLADAWWNAAASEDDATGRALYRHAGQYYEQAKPEVSDADMLARIDSRLQELAKLEQAPESEVPDEDASPQHNFEKLGLFEGRTGETRRLLLQARGGDADTESAVAAALDWLAQHQMPDGGWSFDHAVATGGVGSNGGSMPQARNAATGLVLLAFLGAGQTHKSGTYSEKVDQGLRFLGKRVKVLKDRSGSFNEEGGTMYSHAIAAQTLCEAYAMTRDKDLLVPCQMALAYTIRSQHPMKGGWRYTPKQEGDTSVTGWQMTALKLGSEAGITPPTATLALTGRFLDGVQYDGGAKYGYTGPGGSDSTTAIGLLCRMHLGWPRDHAALKRGIDHLMAFAPADKPMYYNYYATQVFQNYGGQPWDKWNGAMRKFLLEKQATQEPAAGSWWISGKNSREGGRLCCTALATLMLESYYRYLPVYPETRRELARRLSAAATADGE
jgi:hypothetical protein